MAEVVRVALRRALTRGFFFGAITLATFGSITILLWQGGRLVLGGQLSAGALFSFVLYTFTVAGAVASLANLFSSYQEAVGAARRGVELLGKPPPPADPPDPPPLAAPA